MVSRKKLADAVRALSIDAVQKANSGHPGMPMGMADIAQVLFSSFLKHNPSDANWLNRDRFVVSNGHGSMLLYALLHLTGYDISIEDIKQFRQLHSKTPGHPEVGCTPGVETTTGPLGQGLANAVGMAIAEKNLASVFNKEVEIIDHHTYCFVGDGCLMEGISHEVCSLAGTLGLGKMIVFWDQNGISIDGKIDKWFSENTPARFAAYNWQVIDNIDGHDHTQVEQAIIEAQSNQSQPTLICCKTIIGYGSPNKAGSAGVHGSPLGKDEVILTKRQLGWEHDEFYIPEEIRTVWDARATGSEMQNAWQKQFDIYKRNNPQLATELLRRIAGKLPDGYEHNAYNKVINVSSQVATRKASQDVLNELGKNLPELLGGSADLTGSNLTLHANSKAITKEDFSGNYIYYGVREFGMSAIMNGLALHGGYIPYAGTFLVFSDYARNAIRLSALMRKRVIYVMTHDSIGLGEDGPTHQPIEHLASLRIIPNLHVWRPCDALETTVSWCEALQASEHPSVLALSRQKLGVIDRQVVDPQIIAKGGYVVRDFGDKVQVVVIATGSEVEIAMAAAQNYHTKKVGIRVVSMPCAEIFAQQSEKYQKSVLTDKPKVAIEAGHSNYWYRWVGHSGRVVGIDEFGDSAPGDIMYKTKGITVENLISKIESCVLSKLETCSV
ncbi:MAG: transketolase [Francisellaceae bacterium]|nr:transketolase [Francisellaceae bacterium]MBT6538428.1 transketolase [Francisellaceae bacterium]